MRLSKPVVLSVVLTAIVCTSVSVAIAGSSGSMIHGCVAKHGGALRIAKRCRHSERAISWNRSGPAGPRGAQGPAGSNGSNGAPGTPGIDGTARAYAYVNGATNLPGHQPSFNPSATKGFTAVSEPENGEYCLTAPGLDPANTAPVVGSAYASGLARLTVAELWPRSGQSTPACAAGQYTVLVLDTTGTATPNADFTIAVP